MGKVISKPKAPKPVVIAQPDVEKVSVADKESERQRNKAAQFAALTSGRSQTIKTSLRGVLSDKNAYASKNTNLLG